MCMEATRVPFYTKKCMETLVEMVNEALAFLFIVYRLCIWKGGGRWLWPTESSVSTAGPPRSPTPTSTSWTTTTVASM